MGLVRHWSRRRDLALSEEEKPESVDVIREIIRSAVVRVAGIFAAVYGVFVFTQEQERQVENGIVEVHFSTLVAVASAEVRARGRTDDLALSTGCIVAVVGAIRRFAVGLGPRSSPLPR